MWARIHKVDRVKPQPNGSAIVIVEDERNAAQMATVQGLSITIAVALVLNAKRAIDLKFNCKGEVRYCSTAALPDFLMAHVSDTKDRAIEAQALNAVNRGRREYGAIGQ